MADLTYEQWNAGRSIAFGWLTAALGFERVEHEMELLRLVADGTDGPLAGFAVAVLEDRLEQMRAIRRAA